MKYKTKIGDKSIEQEQYELGRKSWPEFMQHDSIVEKYWSSLYTDFLDIQFASYFDDKIAGVGNSIPIHWKDNFKNLPAGGLDWAMEKAVSDLEKELTPNLLVAVQILINPELRSKGLSYQFIDLMKQVARTQGIEYIALPVRPTQKHLYPLIDMEEYSKWTNQKGEPFDSWIRVHLNSGGEIVSICSKSMTIRGTVNEWEKWTGLTFQSSGLYTIEKALCPIEINIEKNFGEYIEPNIWIIHKV